MDAFFLATNAPGRSAFNRVERRMVKLSKELSGVILQHDKFGSHLDGKGETIDKDLELRNFQYAGHILADIWSELVIDGNPVVAEFIEDEAPVVMESKSEEWKACHVRQSQYFPLIVNCSDENCCTRFKSSYLKVVPERFLPPPIPILHTINGVECAKDDKDATHLSLYQNISLRKVLTPNHVARKYPKGVPYDYFCPSVKQDMINRRLCSHCGLYFGTVKAKVLHKSHCRQGATEDRTETVRVQPMRIAARRQRKLSCEMAMQEMEWISIDDVDMEDHDLSNVTDAHQETGTPVVDGDVAPLWFEEIED